MKFVSVNNSPLEALEALMQMHVMETYIIGVVLLALASAWIVRNVL